MEKPSKGMEELEKVTLSWDFLFSVLFMIFLTWLAIFKMGFYDEMPRGYMSRSGPPPQELSDTYEMMFNDTVWAKDVYLNKNLIPGDTIYFFDGFKPVWFFVDKSEINETKKINNSPYWVVPECKEWAYMSSDSTLKGGHHVLLNRVKYKWDNTLLNTIKKIFEAFLRFIFVVILTVLMQYLISGFDYLRNRERGGRLIEKYKLVVKENIVFVALMFLVFMFFLSADRLLPDFSQKGKLKNKSGQTAIADRYIIKIPEVFNPYDTLCVWGPKKFTVKFDKRMESAKYYKGTWKGGKEKYYLPADARIVIPPNTIKVYVAYEGPNSYKEIGPDVFSLEKEIAYYVFRSKTRYVAAWYPSEIFFVLGLLVFLFIIYNRYGYISRIVKNRHRIKEKEMTEKRLKEKKIKEFEKRFDELKFEADRSVFERTDEFRFNYVIKNLDYIINQKEQIEQEHKQFFYHEGEFKEYCIKKDSKDILAYKSEPYLRLKMALDLDLKKPAAGSLLDQMEKSIERIWVEESTGMIRVALRREFTESYEEKENFNDVLKSIEEIYNKIKDNSKKRFEELTKNVQR